LFLFHSLQRPNLFRIKKTAPWFWRYKFQHVYLPMVFFGAVRWPRDAFRTHCCSLLTRCATRTSTTSSSSSAVCLACRALGVTSSCPGPIRMNKLPAVDWWLLVGGKVCCLWICARVNTADLPLCVPHRPAVPSDAVVEACMSVFCPPPPLTAQIALFFVADAVGSYCLTLAFAISHTVGEVCTRHSC
jgi:hypothetical protein